MTFCAETLEYLKGIEQTASLVMMIGQITIDCIPFVSILITVFAFFATTFFVLKVPANVSSVGESFFHTYLMGVLAAFELGELDDSDNPSIAKAIQVDITWNLYLFQMYGFYNQHQATTTQQQKKYLEGNAARRGARGGGARRGGPWRGARGGAARRGAPWGRGARRGAPWEGGARRGAPWGGPPAQGPR